jgi:hypothetical protein
MTNDSSVSLIHYFFQHSLFAIQDLLCVFRDVPCIHPDGMQFGSPTISKALQLRSTR